MKQPHNTRSQLILMFVAFAFGMILSNLLTQSRALQEAPDREEVLITYRGMDKTLDDLPEDIATAYRALSARTAREQQLLLQTAALQWALAEYAQTHELSDEEAARAYLDWRVPDEQAIGAFYRQQSALIDKPFFEVKEEIARYLGAQQVKQVRQLRLTEMMERGDLILFPDRPETRKVLPSVSVSSEQQASQ